MQQAKYELNVQWDRVKDKTAFSDNAYSISSNHTSVCTCNIYINVSLDFSWTSFVRRCRVLHLLKVPACLRTVFTKELMDIILYMFTHVFAVREVHVHL